MIFVSFGKLLKFYIFKQKRNLLFYFQKYKIISRDTSRESQKTRLIDTLLLHPERDDLDAKASQNVTFWRRRVGHQKRSLF